MPSPDLGCFVPLLGYLVMVIKIWTTWYFSFTFSNTNVPVKEDPTLAITIKGLYSKTQCTLYN